LGNTGHNRRFDRIMYVLRMESVWVMIFAWWLSLAGCGFHAPIAPLFDPGEPGRSPTAGVVAGDFDDVESAMYAATVAAEVVDIGISHPSADQVRFELTTLESAPGWMTATLRPDGLIELRSRIGRFGDVKRERRLIAAVAARLEELRGRLAAPVRDRVPPPPAAPASPP
jgi:hypothetical protein